MDQGKILEIFQSALIVSFKLAGPMLVVSLVVGLVIAIFQAATQIHEQTLTFLPKVVVIAVMLLILGSWMMTIITEFFNGIFDMISLI